MCYIQWLKVKHNIILCIFIISIVSSYLQAYMTVVCSEKLFPWFCFRLRLCSSSTCAALFNSLLLCLGLLENAWELSISTFLHMTWQARLTKHALVRPNRGFQLFPSLYQVCIEREKCVNFIINLCTFLDRQVH